MFGFFHKKESIEISAPPEGDSEVIICVFNEKQQVLHHFTSIHPSSNLKGWFKLLNDPDRAFESCVLSEAVSSHRPVSISFSYGEGENKYLYVLPYERKKGQLRFVCMQVATGKTNPDPRNSSPTCALAEHQVCLLLADGEGLIQTASAKVPKEFGFTSDNLVGRHLSDLFAPADWSMISACLPDTNEPTLNCAFRCMDGAKRDVQVKTFSMPDGYTLYGICDATRPQLNEEITLINTRERRRIGQDLHDSIGQLLTGISLLSRSLANGLKRDGSSGGADAAQISELADDANNQIRQISRGLMPSDIVRHGLFASLQNLARTTTVSCGVICESQLDETVTFADRAVETHLLRIAQESVNNAVRHAGATRIDIIVSQVDGLPQLEIRDDGKWKGIEEDSGGIGMKTMQYRASAICGELQVGPVEQGGTAVVCRLEVDESLETRA